MNANTEIESVPAVVPAAVSSAEQRQLKAVFDELRKNQVTNLNEAGKRVIELSTGMLGILFAVVAFGKDFPPPYLQDRPAQILAVVALLFFFLALLAGVLCVQPQEYRDYPNNLDGMRQELARANRWKAGWFRAGTILFGLGAFWLACLIAAIIL